LPSNSDSPPAEVFAVLNRALLDYRGDRQLALADCPKNPRMSPAPEVPTTIYYGSPRRGGPVPAADKPDPQP
jgi:hypothetical protein